MNSSFCYRGLWTYYKIFSLTRIWKLYPPHTNFSTFEIVVLSYNFVMKYYLIFMDRHNSMIHVPIIISFNFKFFSARFARIHFFYFEYHSWFCEFVSTTPKYAWRCFKTFEIGFIRDGNWRRTESRKSMEVSFFIYFFIFTIDN